MGVLAGAALLCARASVAEACSEPLPYCDAQMRYPEHGATGIARNVSVQVCPQTDSCWQGIALEPRLQSAKGSVIATSFECAGGMLGWPCCGYLTPVAPLEPLSAYEVWSTRARPCPDGGICETDERVGGFWTGEAIDRELPVLRGEVAATFGGDVCDEDACCGPYTMVSVWLDWPDATDDVDIAGYRVYAGERAVGWSVGSHALGTHVCSGRPVEWIRGFDLDPGIYRIHAVDGVRNQSAKGVTFEVGSADLSCPAGSDAGPTPDAMADAGPIADGDADDSGDGCGCGARRGAAPGFWLVALVALALSRCRSRR